MKTTLALCLVTSLLTTACQTQPTEQQPAAAPAQPAAAAPPTAAPAALDTAQVRQWLVASIDTNFSNEAQERRNTDPQDPTSIYTPQYVEYKLDAIQLEFAEEEDAEQKFQQKWSGRYNPQLVGNGTFLFVQGQDYGKVRVTGCKFKERTKDQGLLFTVTTKDDTYHTQETGDIKVISTPQGYKIDDVREY
ncbi:hypothetical protein [Hymenobacter chitinivorans]|uniref:Lipoprotein n=1 Tax=Hymenobacter chitinivorans DSM 11115 TaxID=1121954 RepID=A0A2M9BM79_9BACT|nr:hypothetical protein [Hymenobacter chitinivorans]PJJ59066.1 hypothetical protein CLV45_0479 [Hymenobacter chitinivorans DSM 11115]